MITEKLKQDIQSILEQEQVDESLRSAALGAAGLGLGAIGAYSMMDREPPKEPVPQIRQTDTKQPQIKAPVAQPKQKSGNHLENAIKNLSEMEKYFVKKAIQHGIEGVELVAFLAQVAHETGNFESMVENGPKKYFRRYEMKHNPATAKILGNVKPGDGERFKGRSFVQLTGRDNYMRAGRALGLPLVEKPQLLENPSIGFKASLWYWETRVKNKIDNFEDVETVTKLINGGTNGLEDRKQKFEKYMSILSAAK